MFDCMQQKRKMLEQSAFSHKNDVTSVPVGVCQCVEIRLHEFDITVIDPRVKINEICYCDFLCHNSCCLPFIKSVEFNKLFQCTVY